MVVLVGALELLSLFIPLVVAGMSTFPLSTGQIQISSHKHKHRAVWLNKVGLRVSLLRLEITCTCTCSHMNLNLHLFGHEVPRNKISSLKY